MDENPSSNGEDFNFKNYNYKGSRSYEFRVTGYEYRVADSVRQPATRNLELFGLLDPKTSALAEGG